MEYNPELNFSTEIKLNRNGMVLEVKKEFDIIRLALSQLNQLGPDYTEILDRIAIMPLRKLLLEKEPLVLQLCPDFKMPKTEGVTFVGDDKLHMELAPYEFGEINTWISLEDWSKQLIAYFEKDICDLPNYINDPTFSCIINKLKDGEKTEFQSLFNKCTVEYQGDTLDVYGRIDPQDATANSRVYELMKKAGYYDLSVYDFIKHLSDKRGAHIDPGIAPLVTIINGDKEKNLSAVSCFALQLIYAAKKQIRELDDYWPEMVSIINTM